MCPHAQVLQSFSHVTYHAPLPLLTAARLLSESDEGREGEQPESSEGADSEEDGESEEEEEEPEKPKVTREDVSMLLSPCRP